MHVRYCYNFVAGLVHQLCPDAAHISRALHDYTSLTRRHLETLDALVYNKQYAATRRFTPARRPAKVDRLARDHRVNSVTCVHRIGVHNPRHGLLVGVHIGSRHVLLRSDEVEQLGRVTARHPLDLAHGHLLRVADDAALGAAEWNVDHGALPSHPGRQSAHLVDIHVRRVTDAALGWTARKVVLHAKAFEDLDAA